MIDARRIVDEVRFRLQSSDSEPTEELERLAGEYARLCRDVNVRLRRCGEFLKQGLRTEATHLADAEPNLLDLFATLDFPERAEWDDFLVMLRVPRPEPLLADQAAELNEAYALHAPLEKLLNSHRLLALMRAPICERLTLMRKIAEADPASPFWDDDIRALEKARATEIKEEARAAAERRDGDALYALAAEISSPAWRSPPPATVSEIVRQYALRLVADELLAAYSSGSRERALGLRQQWRDLALRSRKSATEPLAQQIGPVLKWLAAEESKSEKSRSYSEKLAELEQVVASATTSPADLERARRAVLQHQRNIPEPLAGRFYARLVTLKQSQRNRRRKVIAAASVGCALLVGLGGIMIRNSNRAAVAKRATDAADQLISQGRLAEARHVIEETSEISASDQLPAVRVKLVEAEKKAERRAQNFHAAIERARSATTREEADGALREADLLATTNDERLLVADITSKWNVATQEVIRNDEDRFQQQLAEANDLLDLLEDQPLISAPDQQFQNLLKRAEQKLRELKRSVAHSKPANARHVDAAESRLARVQRGVAGIEMRTALLEALTHDSLLEANVPDAEAQIRRFAVTLKKFAAEFPSDPKARDFASVSSEVEIWRGVVAWQQLHAQWKSPWPSELSGIRLRLGQCRAWLADYGKSAPTPVVREYAAFLRRMASRDEDDSGDEKAGVRSKLLDLFSGPLLEDAHILEFTDGRVYYLKNRFDAQKAEKISFQYYIGQAGEMKAKAALASELKLGRSREAPQTQVCRKARTMLNKVTLNGWDDALLEIAQSLHDDRELDPFLRYNLLLQTLECAGEGNPALEVELEPIVMAMRDKQINLGARWMNPDDAEASRSRLRAEEKLKRIGDLKPLWTRAQHSVREAADRVFEPVIPVGWLAQDPSGGWQCRSEWAPGGDQSLWVAISEGDDKPARWHKIGIARAAEGLSIEKESAAHVAQGRLVFARGPTVAERAVAN
jgi:hypothetical protein